MDKITKAAIRRPVTVIVVLMGLVLFGVVSVRSMALKLMPDINVPMMVVVATYPGASPEEVDENVMDKIRASCSSIPDLKKTIMQSYENYGMVMFQFNYGTDLKEAHDNIRNQIDFIINDLPEKTGTPTIVEMDFEAIDDMQLSLTTESDDADLLKLVEGKLEPQLRKAGSLADISITGGDETYVAVRIIPEYASQYGVNAASLVAAIQSMNYSMPAGSVSYGNQTLNMESAVHYNELEEIRQIPITTARGQTIHLYDIAEVTYGVTDKTELSRYNGNETISIGLKRRQTATSVTLSNEVKRILEDFQEEYPQVHVEMIYDSADEIVETLWSVAKTLVLGVALAMAVIFLFFGDIKGSLIVGVTMPISLLAALVCMNFAGISLNVVSMNGLVLSIGMITDNAVVVIEMCFRKQEEGMSYRKAAYEGAKIVMNSIIGSTITTVVVYLPLVMLEGLSGQMFKQMGLTIVFVLMASLISAITFVPFFFSLYRPKERKNNPVTKIINAIGEVYGRVLAKMLNFKALVLVLSIALFVLAIFLASGMPTELIATADEGIVQMDVKFRPNLSLENMNATVLELEKFVADTGMADDCSATITESSSSATVMAYKNDDVKLTTLQIVDAWNEALQDFSDMCEITVSAGSSSMTGSVAGGATEEIDIAADDIASLREASDRVTALLRETPGVLTVTSTMDESGARIMIDVDPEMARAKGFSAQQISQMVYMNMEGSDAGEVTIDKETYDVKVEYPKGYFATADDVQAMTFMNATGVSVPLSEIANVRFEQGSQMVARTDGRFSATIEAVMTEETQARIMEELQPKLDALDLGEGANYIESVGDEMMDEEFAAIGQAIVIALYLVFMVMAIQFESIAYSVLIMLCIPFAAIGSVFMLLLLNVKLSMTALLGVMMLAGIVVNNGIIYIDTANRFRQEGEEARSALIH
ncbi:MAG: efflux RND transporter permease subunit, partial [Lachnospiraceae bacterium]|nr:efflux RND transporter permease subunit [Lachnospiraceae bacterium]